MKALRFLAMLLATLDSGFAQSVQGNAPNPEACNGAPAKLQGGSLHLLRVEVLSSRPSDGTYSDEGFGQGEFGTVRLVDVIKSPIRWSRGLAFRVHPFQGKRDATEALAPEHLTVGKRYILVYTYHLSEVPHGDSDLIGLTRCGVHDNTPAAERDLLRSLELPARSR